MTVFVNDKAQEFPQGATLATLAEVLQLPSSGIALALDCNVIKREMWSQTPLSDQAKVIIIKAVCGG